MGTGTFLNLIHNTVTKHLALLMNIFPILQGIFENLPIHLLKCSVGFSQTDFLVFIPKVSNILEEARDTRWGVVN